MKYSEQLKHPKWQKKRLKILERDNWQCTMCSSKDKTLHVHHIQYSGKAWQAKDDQLITLCEDCHDLEHTSKDWLQGVIEAIGDEIGYNKLGELIYLILKSVIENGYELTMAIIKKSLKRADHIEESNILGNPSVPEDNQA